MRGGWAGPQLGGRGRRPVAPEAQAHSQNHHDPSTQSHWERPGPAPLYLGYFPCQLAIFLELY